MRRREFITLFGGAAAAWPLGARLQRTTAPVIGLINTTGAKGFEIYLDAFRKGLGERGYVEGRNVTIEYRWAENESSRLPALAADLVNRQVDVIVSLNNASTLAAKSTTSTIPIVFSVAFDPVAAGLVSSLNRPGGNLTGVTSLNVE
jgi:putative ABC transport system substrate-binding protein